MGCGVVGAVWLPPLIEEPVRSMVMGAFSGLCHQLPARSLHVGGTPLAVCDRCLGIYTGLLLGVILLPLVSRRARRLHRNAGLAIAISLVPLAIDWLGPVVGGWSNGPVSRVATGGLFGAVAGLLVTYAVVSAGRRSVETAPPEGE
jgi:uncharacterized membrane protein